MEHSPPRLCWKGVQSLRQIPNQGPAETKNGNAETDKQHARKQKRNNSTWSSMVPPRLRSNYAVRVGLNARAALTYARAFVDLSSLGAPIARGYSGCQRSPPKKRTRRRRRRRHRALVRRAPESSRTRRAKNSSSAAYEDDAGGIFAAIGACSIAGGGAIDGARANRSEWAAHMDEASTVRAPAWCEAARGRGAQWRSVVIPREACSGTRGETTGREVFHGERRSQR